MNSMNEDSLVQQTTAYYLYKQLGWESIDAYNNEDFGPGSLIIPMDLAYQDHGMFQAYGLLFQLLRQAQRG